MRNAAVALASVHRLLFGFCLIALIEGILLHPYGLVWFVPVVGIALFLLAKIAPRLLGP
jgi:NhaP-type Na+/H+ or K+/H+ antiporter